MTIKQESILLIKTAHLIYRLRWIDKRSRYLRRYGGRINVWIVTIWSAAGSRCGILTNKLYTRFESHSNNITTSSLHRDGSWRTRERFRGPLGCRTNRSCTGARRFRTNIDRLRRWETPTRHDVAHCNTWRIIIMWKVLEAVNNDTHRWILGWNW